MRLMFAYHLMGIRAGDAGSVRDIHGYARAARALGHEVVVYGPADTHPSLSLSLDVAAADAAVFVFEWTTQLREGDQLDLLRLVGGVPRARRVVLDCDGAYNDALALDGDYNHRDAAAARRWVETCDSLADKVCQPTLRPLRPNVRPFLFYAYDPAWELPLDFRAKEYGMLYVGHSKFRWRPLARVLRAVEPVRPRVGRLALVGHGWDAPPPWAGPMRMEDAYATDPAYLRRLGVEVRPAVPFGRVIGWMSRATFNPVLLRPTFGRLGLVTPRLFETPAAGTIPLLGPGAAHVPELYGEGAGELVLPDEEPQEKILDLVSRPERYAAIVAGIRRHLAERHSHAARLRQLIEIVES